jgi:pilus assembly protein CpaE
MRSTALQVEALTSAQVSNSAPDVVLLDLRDERGGLAAVPILKRRYPHTAIAIVARSFAPELMLEAMRAGVNEVLAEPLSEEALRASLHRILVPKPAAAGTQLIAVLGAKGGVGATTVAVNLAEAVARTSGNALLIDLHLGVGDSAVFLGVEPRFTVIEALENTHRLDAAFLRGLLVHTKSGLELLGSTPRVVQGTVDPQRVRTLLEFALTFSTCTILDLPRQDLGLLESLDATTSIFVVVNQELPTLRNANPLVKRLQQRYGERVAVLVNRSDRNSEISLDDVTKAVGVPIRHVFPNDYRLAMSAANKGQPIASSTQSRLAESFYILAKSLGAETRKKAATEESSRLFGWLSPRK